MFWLCLRFGDGREVDSYRSKTGHRYRRGVLSKVVDWRDRSTAVLFGDGAGGVLLSDQGTYPLIEKEVLAADGTRGASLTSGYRLVENPYYQEASEQTSALTMDGREIFDFVIRDVVKSLKAMLGAEAQDIDYFLLHQANARILEKVARKP